MPAKNIPIVLQWKRNAIIIGIVLGLFGIANESSADTTYSAGSSVPPAVARNLAADNRSSDATKPSVTNTTRNSVVFKKQKRALKKPADCGSSGSCSAQQNIAVPRRPQRPAGIVSGAGVSASNGGQAAKVKVLVPF